MADGLPAVFVNNAELVGIVAVTITSFLFRHFRGEWPLLSKFRRRFLPFLHEVVMKPVGGYAAREQRTTELVGTYDITLKELHKELRSAKHIYPNNFASIKYIEFINDEGKVVRKYEDSSWAHRPEGITGKIQNHMMIYRNKNGTIDIYAHHELNPIPNPVKHYNGSPDVWSEPEGVKVIKGKMDELDIEKV